MFGKVLKSFIHRNKWTTVFFTQDSVAYNQAKGVLVNNSIRSKTRISGHGFNERSAGWSANRHHSYEIFVRESDLYRANGLIHKV